MKTASNTTPANEQLPLPVKIIGEDQPIPTKAPDVGEHTEQVLTEILEYDKSRISELRENGAFG